MRRTTLLTHLLLSLCLFLVLTGSSCPSNEAKTISDANPVAGSTTTEALGVRSQGSPVVVNNFFGNGPTPGNPASNPNLTQGIVDGTQQGAVDAFKNNLVTTADGGTHQNSPGQIYSQHGNSVHIAVTSGSTTPTQTGGGASGSAAANATTSQDASATQEVTPTVTVPLTLAVGAAPTANGAPTAATGPNANGGAQTNSNRTDARNAFLENENAALKDKIIEMVLTNDTADGETEVTGDETGGA